MTQRCLVNLVLGVIGLLVFNSEYVVVVLKYSAKGCLVNPPC